MGFTPEKQNGTSHEHWTKIVTGKLYKVTVDYPKFYLFCSQEVLSRFIENAVVFAKVIASQKPNLTSWN